MSDLETDKPSSTMDKDDSVEIQESPVMNDSVSLPFASIWDFFEKLFFQMLYVVSWKLSCPLW